MKKKYVHDAIDYILYDVIARNTVWLPKVVFFPNTLVVHFNDNGRRKAISADYKASDCVKWRAFQETGILY